MTICTVAILFAKQYYSLSTIVSTLRLHNLMIGFIYKPFKHFSIMTSIEKLMRATMKPRRVRNVQSWVVRLNNTWHHNRQRPTTNNNNKNNNIQYYQIIDKINYNNGLSDSNEWNLWVINLKSTLHLLNVFVYMSRYYLGLRVHSCSWGGWYKLSVVKFNYMRYQRCLATRGVCIGPLVFVSCYVYL